MNKNLHKFLREEFPYHEARLLVKSFVLEAQNRVGEKKVLALLEEPETFIPKLCEFIGISTEAFQQAVGKLTHECREVMNNLGVLTTPTLHEYIVYTDEGRALDNNGREVPSMQILDFIEAKSLADAEAIALRRFNAGDYGAFGEKSLSFRQLA